MKYLFTLLTALCCCLTSMAASPKSNHAVPFRFATKAEAQMLITNIDQFTNNWNQFDINVRLQTNEGKKSQLLTVAMNATRNWSDQEKQRISKIIKELEASLTKLNASLPFPEEVILVKTSMEEEGKVIAYTRENWIALGEEALSELDNETLREIMAHELFHVLTRNSMDFKKAIYATIGFNITRQEIIFPAELVNKRISNPDISRHDSYASFLIDGKEQNCTMVLYTDREYTEGGLTDYLNVGLVPLDEHFIPLQQNGETVIYPISKAENFYEKVGRNTNYTIHPEEVLADNFAYTLTNTSKVKDSEIIQRIKEVLKGQYKGDK